ncbi:hypothetical protein AYI69_g11432 [Smittium culicis]|uniref:Retrovirus-related Pol polyprotein from transposon n=1 Tax=Smittium culicis TaxID=133412 RepID=A0A1R1WYU0_9FUNG|nr:hypothetical protein AYI69_g11432 [Smittium culicis]
MLKNAPILKKPKQNKKFDLSTDVSSVSQSEPTGQLVIWVHLLYEYDCEIKYRAGKDNSVADYLSRPGLVGFLDTVSSEVVGFDDLRLFLETGKTPPGLGMTKILES